MKQVHAGVLRIMTSGPEIREFFVVELNLAHLYDHFNLLKTVPAVRIF